MITRGIIKIIPAYCITMASSKCFLFTPGNKEELANKGWKYNPDYIILDLEDSVPISEKENARNIVKKVTSYSDRKWAVRVNALSTEYWFADVTTVLNNNIDILMVPKVECPEELIMLDNLLTFLEKERNMDHKVKLIPLIESSRGLVNMESIACSSKRILSMSLGAVDLANELGITPGPDNNVINYAKAKLLIASSVAGISPPYDSVSTNFRDLEALKQECKRAKENGFIGKHAIHPAQVGVIKEVFSSSEKEIENAKVIVKEYEKAVSEGKGAVKIEGNMIDYPVYLRAKKLLNDEK